MSPVGILGGSFNPPHAGHLVCARMAAEQLGFDRVLVTPLCEAPHRTLDGDPGARERLEMCRLAVAEDPVLEACDDEVERGGTSYTVETLEALAGSGAAPDPTLILGADAARGLPGWKEPGRVLELAGLAIAPRGPGGDAEQAAKELRALFPDARIGIFSMPLVEFSSSLVRERVAAGLSVRDMVPPDVAALIESEGWYGGGAS